MPHPTSSRDFDAIRAQHPEVQFYVYALVLGGVVLELITPDQQVYRFDGPTLADALEAAFPPAPATPDRATATEMVALAAHLTTDLSGYLKQPTPEASAMTPDIFD